MCITLEEIKNEYVILCNKKKKTRSDVSRMEVLRHTLSMESGPNDEVIMSKHDFINTVGVSSD